MKRRSSIILIIILLTMTPTISQNNSLILKAISSDTNEPSLQMNDWYYLPSFSNYAPNGLPDFDQRQDETWRTSFSWSFCGPTALADILWWFDSKHEDENGYPGDGKDIYPIVQTFSPPGIPLPGPLMDDHNFNNVNDCTTSWSQYSKSGELIESLATYVDIYWYKIPFITISGTDRFQLAWGAKQWIKDAGLEKEYTVENINKPSFSLIVDRLQKNQGIILRLGYYIPDFPRFFPLIFAHYVAVAGIHPDGYISVSDPEWDIANPCSDPFLHNNPSNISHDTYQVNLTSPYPAVSSWWIPSFERHRRVIVIAAIIISEI
ncbi:MAG: hypothetical protein V1769_06550 [Thermoplasmatota archaeon]